MLIVNEQPSPVRYRTMWAEGTSTSVCEAGTWSRGFRVLTSPTRLLTLVAVRERCFRTAAGPARKASGY